MKNIDYVKYFVYLQLLIHFDYILNRVGFIKFIIYLFLMAEQNFFGEQTPSSRIKAKIVSEYFPQYCRIISRKFMPSKFRYIDLFSGPGVYGDGNYSTPILIGNECAGDPMLRNRVWMIFNDAEYSDSLEQNFKSFFPDDTFYYKPYFGKRTVGECAKMDEFLMKSTMVQSGRFFKNDAPSVLFFDPFGYKGIKTKILCQFMSYWGNEVFLFINIKRILPALYNPQKREDLLEIFPSMLDSLKADIDKMEKPYDKHQHILDVLKEEFQKNLGGTVYMTAFRFLEEDQSGASHYLIHFTKGLKGYDLIKSVCSKYDNVKGTLDGNFTYTFDPKKVGESDSSREFLEMFDEEAQSVNINYLISQILKDFGGKIISAESLYLEHHSKSRYSMSHYLRALREMEARGMLNAEFVDGKNHNVSVLISKDCILDIPS